MSSSLRVSPPAEEFFAIAKIIDVCYGWHPSIPGKKSWLFRVCWEGYPGQDTWEPRDVLKKDVPELLAEFEKARKFNPHKRPVSTVEVKKKDTLYPMDKIIDVKDGKHPYTLEKCKLYRVCWTDFPDEDSWEPRDFLEANYPDKWKQFELKTPTSQQSPRQKQQCSTVNPTNKRKNSKTASDPTSKPKRKRKTNSIVSSISDSKKEIVQKPVKSNVIQPPTPSPIPYTINQTSSTIKDDILDTLSDNSDFSVASSVPSSQFELQLQSTAEEESGELDELQRSQIENYYKNVSSSPPTNDQVGLFIEENVYTVSPFHSARVKQQWDEILKDATRSRPSIYNNIDNDGPPDSLTWIETNVYPETINTTNLSEFAIACNCSGESSCLDSKCTCPQAMLEGIYRMYDEDGKVQYSNDEYVLIECIAGRCGCDPKYCKNRVVQNSPIPRLQLRKFVEKGWGLVTLQKIPAHTFVIEYVGEIIPPEEAEKRAKTLKKQGKSTYLFNIDKGMDDGNEYIWSIDAEKKGNASRFLNHSCDPNLRTYAVCYHHQDPCFHSIAFFANRDIEVGEELTFSYDGNYGDSMGRRKRKSGVKCLCGSGKCRGKLFICS